MTGPGGRLVSRRTLLLGVGGVASTWPTAGCSGGTSPPAPPIVLAGGSRSGVYDQYARAWSAAAGRRSPLRVLSTTGSVANIKLLRTGETALAFSALDAAGQALGGSSPIEALAKLYDDYMHLVVLGTSRIRTIADLHGRRVCVGAASSGTTLIADRLLAAAGIDPHAGIVRSQLVLDESVRELESGQIDALFWSGGLPTMAVATLAADRTRVVTPDAPDPPVRLIDLADQARVLRVRYGTTYRIGVIPGHTYAGVTTPVSTLAVPNVLLTTDRLPDAEGLRLTRLLFADAPRIAKTVPVAAQLDPHTAIYTQPVPLHSGALRYYRSVAIDV